MRVVKSQQARLIKRRRIFELAKGFYGRRKNCYTIAIRAVHKALQQAYKGRRDKKGIMRRLFISRINSAAREHGIGYSQFTEQMSKQNILLNRKILATLAVHEPRTFRSLAEIAKSKGNDGLLAALD